MPIVTFYLECLRTAREAAKCSGDQSVQVGAVLVHRRLELPAIGGCNDFPEGVVDSQWRRQRPQKYWFTEHAERAVIYRAATLQVDFSEYVLACTQYPCADCARAIILTGVDLVLVPKNSVVPTFADSSKAAREMFKECAVQVIEF